MAGFATERPINESVSRVQLMKPNLLQLLLLMHPDFAGSSSGKGKLRVPGTRISFSHVMNPGC